MKIHYKIRISGKVQGVFFRASTKTKAIELGVVGLVKNEKDGAVYVEAEGETEAMEKFLQWCGKGPLNARVDKVEMAEAELKNFEEFRILH